MSLWLTVIAISYFLGSIPFGYLLVRLFRNEDIRASGSGNIGATNVVRSGAKGLGIATLVLDLLKAYAAVMIALGLGHGAYELAIVAGVCAILGHCFPVWLGFRGGKGAASSLGAVLALSPRAGLCVLGIFLIVVVLTRYVSLGSILAAVSFPISGCWFAPVRTPIVIVGFCLIALLVVLKHHQNIRRLASGTESRFGSGKAIA